MEPEKTVNKKKINLHVNSSTTVKRRSKNFYTVQTRSSGAVSAKLLLPGGMRNILSETQKSS